MTLALRIHKHNIMHNNIRNIRGVGVKEFITRHEKLAKPRIQELLKIRST